MTRFTQFVLQQMILLKRSVQLYLIIIRNKDLLIYILYILRYKELTMLY